MAKSAVPFKMRSLLEKMTPSRLVSPSAAKVPVTDRLLEEAVVTNTLSADFTWMAGALLLVMSRPSSTSCTLSSLSAATSTLASLAVPVRT